MTMDRPTSTRERLESAIIAMWTVESVGSASRTPGCFDKIGHKCAVRGPTSIVAEARVART